MCAPSADWGGAHNFGLYIGASPKEKGTNFGGNNWGTNRAIKESKIPCPSCRDDGLLNMQISHKIKTNVRCWYTCVCNAWIFFFRFQQCCQLCAIDTLLDSHEYTMKIAPILVQSWQHCLFSPTLLYHYYLESFLSTGFDVSLFGLNDNTMFVHSVGLGHVFVAEKTSISNIGGPNSGREKQECKKTFPGFDLA